MAVHCPTGVLTDLTPAEAVALLSALVFQERTDAAPAPGALPPVLEDARDLSVQVTAAGAAPRRHLPLGADGALLFASICGLRLPHLLTASGSTASIIQSCIFPA